MQIYLLALEFVLKVPFFAYNKQVAKVVQTHLIIVLPSEQGR